MREPTDPICVDADGSTGDALAEVAPDGSTLDGDAATDATVFDSASDGAGDSGATIDDADALDGAGAADSTLDVEPDVPSADTSVADADAPCTADSYRCVGADLEKCGADGGFAKVVSCPSAATCSSSLGRCTACVPGAYSCSGAERRQCDSYGAATALVATCASSALCAASTGGTCAAPACSVGESKCDDADPLHKELHSCNAGRTGFDISVCPVACSAGACVKVIDVVGSGWFDSGGALFLALLSDGSVRQWGAAPAAVLGLSGTIVQVAAGPGGAGARRSDGTVMLWLGAVAPYTPYPSVVAGVSGAVDLAIGRAHACVTVTGGAVKCWGDGNLAPLGNGTTASFTPPSFATVTGITATGPLAAGSTGSFVITAAGPRAWGKAPDGQLGTGSMSDALSPTAAFSGAVQVAASWNFACARLPGGTVRCAGVNDDGQLGNGAPGTISASPVDVLGVTGAQQVAVGQSHACAVISGGSVRCWGGNLVGQLGDGSTTSSASPVTVSGISSAKRVAIAGDTTCVLLSDELTVKCWGAGAVLGNGVSPAPEKQLTPVSVAW